jgi:hypothetical protein
MEPFRLSNAVKQLKATYPDKETFSFVLKNCKQTEGIEIIRLWLTEGIPFAFKDNPILYEAVRSEIADRLGTNAKEITIIGSGRIGYSLSPLPEFGNPFNKKSDLDFSIISAELFIRCKNDFETWLSDYVSNSTYLAPYINKDSAKYWPENAKRVPGNIEKGFIDANKIPRLDKYSISQKIGQTAFIIHNKLKHTENSPDVIKTSISVYKNWDAFFYRRIKNLNDTIKSLQ